MFNVLNRVVERNLRIGVECGCKDKSNMTRSMNVKGLSPMLEGRDCRCEDFVSNLVEIRGSGPSVEAVTGEDETLDPSIMRRRPPASFADICIPDLFTFSPICSVGRDQPILGLCIR
jgi:hypothetical protein